MTDQDNQTKFNTNCCPEGVAKVLKVVCKISHDDAMQIKENNNKRVFKISILPYLQQIL